MKLSQAIILGDSLKKPCSTVFLGVNGFGEDCGCAIGGAILAAVDNAQKQVGDIGFLGAYDLALPLAIQKWPFLLQRLDKEEYVPANILEYAKSATVEHVISSMYYECYSGTMSIEQIADWVKSIEDKYDVYGENPSDSLNPETVKEEVYAS